MIGEEKQHGNSEFIDAIAQFKTRADSFSFSGYTYNRKKWSSDEQVQTTTPLTDSRIVFRSINDSFYFLQKATTAVAESGSETSNSWTLSKIDSLGKTIDRRECNNTPELVFDRAKNEMKVTLIDGDIHQGIRGTVNLSITDVYIGQPLLDQQQSATVTELPDLLRQNEFLVFDEPQQKAYAGIEDMEHPNRPVYDLNANAVRVVDVAKAEVGTVVTIGRNRLEDVRGTYTGVAVNVGTRMPSKGLPLSDTYISRQVGRVQLGENGELKYTHTSVRPATFFVASSSGLEPVEIDDTNDLSLNEGLIIRVIDEHDIDSDSSQVADVLYRQSGALKYPPLYVYLKQIGSELFLLRTDDRVKIEHLAQKLAR